MKNITNIKIPKKYQGMLELVEYDGDGYWAYSLDGYQFDGMGCHTAHEDTQKDLLEMIRTLEPCDCEQCIEEEKESNKEKPSITIPYPNDQIAIVTFVDLDNDNEELEEMHVKEAEPLLETAKMLEEKHKRNNVLWRIDLK